MKTQLIKSYGRKNTTLLFMLMFIIVLLFTKHIRAQGLLWLENEKTNQRVSIMLNQKISYKLRTSQNFHKGRITAFTDSTISVHIKGNKLVSLKFTDLKEVILPDGERAVGGALLTTLGAVALIAGISAAVSPTPTATSWQIAPRGSGGIIIGLILFPVGLVLMKGKTINLEKSWRLKTSHNNTF